MSHFPVLVLIDEQVEREGAEKAVTPLLAPYDENGEWFAEGSRWDWWVVGGRWTGALDGYQPHEDIRNYEVCNLCEGTGVRPGGLEEFGIDWFEGCNGCNGCSGNGIRYNGFGLDPHPGDVRPVAQLNGFIPTALITPDGRWHEEGRPGWWGATIEDEEGHGAKGEQVWEAAVKALYEQHPEATAVLVDCHV